MNLAQASIYWLLVKNCDPTWLHMYLWTQPDVVGSGPTTLITESSQGYAMSGCCQAAALWHLLEWSSLASVELSQQWIHAAKKHLYTYNALNVPRYVFLCLTAETKYYLHYTCGHWQIYLTAQSINVSLIRLFDGFILCICTFKWQQVKPCQRSLYFYLRVLILSPI